jgi:putative Holliday junction resolvase
VRWLAVDLGQRRVGIARTDPLGLVALPDRVIAHPGDEARLVEAVAAVGEETAAEGYVVGLPRHMNGTEGEGAAGARRFAEALARRTGRRVELWDERLTTRQADRIGVAADVSRRRRRDAIDRMAAYLILDAYLRSGRAEAPPPGEG